MIVGNELAFSTAAAGAAAAYSEFVPNGTRRAYIREMGMFSQSATAAAKTQLGRPGNTPAGGTVQVGSAQDPSNVAPVSGVVTSGWTTAPTAPSAANTLRQWDFNNVPGSGVIFTWPADGELIAGASRANGIVTWNAGGSAGPACDQYFVWGE